MSHSVIAAVFALGFIAGTLAAEQKPQTAQLSAERVTGIGGVFFKARDPKALALWYREKLGIVTMEGTEFWPFQWREKDDAARLGTTVWSIFRSDSKHFAPSDSTFMINYRVRDLDKMLAQLRALGVTLEGKVVEDFNGKFAWAIDPEGNKIELWEPNAGY